MNSSKGNVKFKLYKYTWDDTQGVSYMTVLASGREFEGRLVDTYGRVEGRAQYPNAEQDRTATHRLFVHGQPAVVSGTFSDDLLTYFKEGNLAIVTKVKDPKSKVWIPFTSSKTDTKKYVISYLSNIDDYGYNLCGYLKESAEA